MLSTNDTRLLSETFPVWKKLTSSQQELILQNASLVQLNKSEFIEESSDGCSGILIIKSGMLRVFTLSEDGRDITFHRLHPGELSILSAACVIPDLTFDIYIEALIPSEVIKISPCAFSMVMEDNLWLTAKTYKLATKRLCSVTWAMQQMMFMSFDKRLAHFLLEESAEQQSLELKITHEQIAKLIGTAREVVTRMLNYFAAEKYVTLSRGKVHIINKQGLEACINK